MSGIMRFIAGPSLRVQVHLIFCVLAAGCVSISALHAKSRNDAIVVYSGFGYLDGGVQPALQKLLYEEDQELWITAGNALMATGKSAVGDGLNGNALGRWSRYDLILNQDDLTSTLQKKLGRKEVRQSDRDAMFDTFETVLGVVIVGGLEVSASQETTARIERQKAYNHWLLTSVTALLVDLKTQQVVLSATAMGADKYSGSLRAVLRDSEMIAMSSVAYAQASRAAVTNLGGLMRSHGLSSLGGKNVDADAHIVTDALVVDSKKNINALFNRRPFTSRPASQCEKTPSCPLNGEDCEKLSAVLAHGMTAALSNAGLMTLPPFGWSRWRGGASTNTTIRLSLPELQNAPKALDNLIFDQDPAAADVKVVPILWSAEPINAQSGDGFSEARTWQVEVNYKTVRTAPEDCAIKRDESEILPSSGPVMADVEAMTGAPGRKSNDPSLDRMLIMMSLHEAFSKQMPNMIKGE